MVDDDGLTDEELAAMSPLDLELALLVLREGRAVDLQRMWDLAHQADNVSAMLAVIDLAVERDVMLDLGDG